jgi:alkylhydroperoxidase/carboxymuconolactone decarboxylase family protein YurZ
MSSSTPDPEALKARFISALSADTFSSDPGWPALLQLSPPLFAASTSILSVPVKKHHLPPSTQSLIALAVSAAATGLHAPGIRTHTAAALRAGATVAEITEIIELTSTLGIHTQNIGIPILTDLLKKEFPDLYKENYSPPLSKEQEKLKADFTTNRGYWNEAIWEDFLRLDPELFAAYVELSSLPWLKTVPGSKSAKGALDPKIKEFVYCAFDVAATHLYVPGLKLHMRNAIGYGATVAEICEVFEIAMALSLRTGAVGAPIVLEEVEKFEREKAEGGK